MKRPSIKARALALLRIARDQHDYHAESMACDYATAALVLEGVDERTARNNVRRAWVELPKAGGV